MCVQVPPQEEVKTIEYLRKLTAQTHNREFWEVGASCNFLIAAARMGLTTAAVANLGEDVYGQFLLDVLEVKLFAPSLTLLYHLALAMAGNFGGVCIRRTAAPHNSTALLVPCSYARRQEAEGSGDVDERCCAVFPLRRRG